MKLRRHQSLPMHASQRGAATLVAVMVLFFIMAMMAAYANRNLVFEQRIASNYFRSGLAAETAEAGLEWAVERLNGGLIDTACADSAAGASSFRSRYLSFSSERVITTNINKTEPVAACMQSATQGWVCQCAGNGVVSNPAVAASTQFQPMFGVALLPVGHAGVVRLRITGCTDRLNSCANDNSASSAGLASAVATVDLGLLSALKMPPASPLTVRGNVDFGSPGLGLHNVELASNGLLMQIGGSYSGLTSRSTSLPGTPAEAALISGDSSLSSPTPERLFASFFGMNPSTYREQPAARRISCEGDCSSTLQQAYAQGFRQLWITGPLSLRSNISLGSEADPVLIVTDGALSIDGPMQIAGLVYARGDVSWINGSSLPATLTGALLADGNVTASGSIDMVYSTAAMNTLNNQRGSLVRVPASWTDAR